MLIGNLVILLAIYFMQDAILADPGQIGSLTAFMNYLTQIMMALIFAGMLMMIMSRAVVSISRISEVLSYESTMTYNKTGIEKLNGEIEFKNV